MTEKRYYAHKYSLQKNKIHDKICHNFMNIDETVEHMNNQYWKYKQLKEENEQLKKDVDYWKQAAHMNNQYWKYKQLKKENEQLKKDVDYWKQVASQKGNEIEVMAHKLQMK